MAATVRPKPCTHKDKADLARLQKSAWPWPLMGIALKLAVAYPLFLMLTQWAISGADTGIGNFIVLTEEPRVWLRVAAIGPLALFIIMSFLAAAWLFFGPFAVAGAVAFAVAGAFAVGLACQNGKGRVAHAGLALTALISITILLAALPANFDANRRLIILTLGLLPALNAIFDYLSYGLTLTLIKKGRHNMNLSTLGYGLIDAGVALCILIALGLSLTGLVALINAYGSRPLLDLEQTFKDLGDPAARGQYTWLMLMLLSTLVPTLVHLVIVLLSAFTWVPRTFKTGLATLLSDEATGDLGTLAGAALGALVAAIYTALFTYGLYGLWLLVTHYIEPLGLFLLSVVAWIAGALGWL